LCRRVAAERPTCLTLEALKAAAIAECLGIRHYADRRDKTLFTELIDLRLCQDFGHGHRDSGATYIRDLLDRQRRTERLFGMLALFTPLADSRIAFARHWERY